MRHAILYIHDHGGEQGIRVIAKTTLANRAAIENAAKFPGNDTFQRTIGLYCYSGHLHILVLLHKILEEIAAVTFVVGNQNFHEDTRILVMSNPRKAFTVLVLKFIRFAKLFCCSDRGPPK